MGWETTEWGIPDGTGKRTLDLHLPQVELQIYYLQAIQLEVDQCISPLLICKIGMRRVPTWKDFKWIQQHVRILNEGSEHPTRGSHLHHLILILTKFPPPPEPLSSSCFH